MYNFEITSSLKERLFLYYMQFKKAVIMYEILIYLKYIKYIRNTLLIVFKKNAQIFFKNNFFSLKQFIY